MSLHWVRNALGVSYNKTDSSNAMYGGAEKTNLRCISMQNTILP